MSLNLKKKIYKQRDESTESNQNLMQNIDKKKKKLKKKRKLVRSNEGEIEVKKVMWKLIKGVL